ncbi:MAG: AzlC family ABC transporter permease [Hyphomicrobiales bacterium]|nr:AzlC family ABC transporter permease [Hyphomicrobiales bacterium]MDE2114894.1 AzlC family ABC transporter permease [Hyphomicrobiales bacterium]
MKAIGLVDTDYPPEAAIRTRFGWWRTGFVQALQGPAWVVAFSLFGIGGLARTSGFPLGAAAAATVLIWAGPAQAIFFVAAGAKTAWSVIALSASLSSIRMFPMTIALLPILRTKKTRIWTMVAASWFMGITVWTESLRRTPPLPREVRLPFFFGFAMACMGLSTISTVLGYTAVSNLPVPLAAALLFMSPLYFVNALMRNAHRLSDWVAVGLGLVLTPIAMRYVGGGFDIAVIGIGGGCTAYLIGRISDSRARVTEADVV